MPERWAYTKGLHDLGNGCFAYLQPDGSWGWSNAGLVTDGGASLLVDTLFDLALTQEMLDRMGDAAPAARDIDILVNSHANGDHTFGNTLVGDADIIASKASAGEMVDFPPEQLAGMMRAAPAMGETGEFLRSIFRGFDFEGIEAALPTRTFEGELKLKVGDKEVRLIEVGPAHTKGDILVHVPSDGVVYCGDILFIHATPILWEGPVSNWIRACELIQNMNADTIVPGHGPIIDKRGVEPLKEYLLYIEREARKRYDAGLDVMEAVADIALDDYSSWGCAERIVINVDTLYREFRGVGTKGRDVAPLFAMMARVARY